MKTLVETYSDAEVIRRVLDGETELFEILIRRNNSYLYKTGRSYNYNHQDTQDLMQDTFIDAYRSLAKFENRSSFKTWLVRIMLNNCYRKQQKFSFKNEKASEITDKSIPMYSGNDHSGVLKPLLARELTALVENALQQIPFHYRIVFSLRETAEMNTQEVSEALGITHSAVKVRLNRAKAMLRKKLEKIYDPHDVYEFNLIYCDSVVENVMKKLPVMQGRPPEENEQTG